MLLPGFLCTSISCQKLMTWWYYLYCLCVNSRPCLEDLCCVFSAKCALHSQCDGAVAQQRFPSVGPTDSVLSPCWQVRAEVVGHPRQWPRHHGVGHKDRGMYLCAVRAPKGRPVMFDVNPLAGISGLSFDLLSCFLPGSLTLSVVSFFF